MKIATVIPAYNAGKTIRQVVRNVKEKVDYTIVVDDGSNDDTYIYAKEEGAITIRHIINRGQGAALQTGTEYAIKIGADIIIHFDADGQHHTENIDKLIEPIIGENYDIVLGTRFKGSENNIPLTKKYFILKPAIILNRFLTGLKLTDVHNGLRAYSKVAAQRVKITMDRMAHSTEIPALIKKNDLKWREVPVKVTYSEYGQGFMGGIEILKDLFIKKII